VGDFWDFKDLIGWNWIFDLSPNIYKVQGINKEWVINRVGSE
jgi:hypothetical protein